MVKFSIMSLVFGCLLGWLWVWLSTVVVLHGYVFVNVAGLWLFAWLALGVVVDGGSVAWLCFG